MEAFGGFGKMDDPVFLVLLVKESIEAGKLMTAIFHFGRQAQRPVLKCLPEQVNHVVTPRRHEIAPP